MSGVLVLAVAGGWALAIAVVWALLAGHSRAEVSA
jgi:hypothetical protein